MANMDAQQPLLQEYKAEVDKQGEEPRKLTWWSLLTISWVNPLLQKGVQGQLEHSDLIPLPPLLAPGLCCARLWQCWKHEFLRHSSNPSLLRAVFYAYGWDYFQIGLLKFINDILVFLGPILLNQILKCLQPGYEGNAQWAYSCAISFGVVSAVRSVLQTHFQYRTAKLNLQLQASLTTMVYCKSMCVSLAQRSCFSTGEIQTFMSVDASRVISLCANAHEIWSLPLQIAVALGMLYLEVKFAFLAGLAVIILLIPVNRVIALKISSSSEAMMKEKDERVQMMGELLKYIRTIKMYTWEQIFTSRILQTRNRELKQLSIKKYMDAFCVYFWGASTVIFTIFTFGLYVVTGHTLDAATVFTSLALFDILAGPLNNFPWVINGIIEAQVSLRRLCRFLSSEDTNPSWITCITETQNVDDTQNVETIQHAVTSISGSYPALHHNNVDKPEIAIMVENADFTWCHSQEIEPLITLSDISLCIPKGSLVAILGKVGAGKSSLLGAILGEMRCVRGKAQMCGSVAYVTQTPWIQSATVRDNILFGAPFDSDRYFNIVKACALEEEIFGMHGGNMAEIVEQGGNLSGGQKARVALARALYQDRDIYILDDPLSAVDAHVGNWILHNAILGPLLRGKTRILCTYNIEALSVADLVILMENGRVTYCGVPSGLKSSLLVDDLLNHKERLHRSQPSTTTMSSSPTMNNNSGPPKEESSMHFDVRGLMDQRIIDTAFETNGSGDMNAPEHPGLTVSSEEPLVPLVEEEARNVGRVQASVYWGYAKFTGWWMLSIILVSTTLMQATENGGDFWLSYWVDHVTDTVHPPSFYLMVMLAFGGSHSLFTLVRAFSFAYGGLQAAYHMHDALLQKVIAAPITFFDRNPRGRILNRFSSDQYRIDDSLPFIANILLSQAFVLTGLVIVLIYAQWTIVVMTLPIGYFFWILQKYYRETSRELRRLNSIFQSPVYTSFIEMLDGCATIRAFRSQMQFVHKNWRNVEDAQRASYSETMASLWLSLRLEIMASFIIGFISIAAVVGHTHSHSTTATAGMVGLGLAYATPIISLLSYLMGTFTETEQEMVSVERMQQYLDVASEEDGGDQQVSPLWPTHGALEFSHVSLVYLSWLPPALKDVSFSIAPQEHIGIAGRTGAGKSSILNSLFRLTPISMGRISIDGVDTSRVPLHQLRSRLTIVPQTPFLFGGTLRDNLDPTSTVSDAKLWETLDMCHLKEVVTAAGGLGAKVSEGGESLSLGQRQLLCLARSLLGTARVLCLDECTANVDPQTTALLMETLATRCINMTVITIAHRISTIIDLHRVLIMEHGRLVEEGCPVDLLKIPDSKFLGLVKASQA